MKKYIFPVILLVLCLLVSFAYAEGEVDTPPAFDWTAIVVSIIGAIATIISAFIARVWMSYVKPWLEKKNLMEAANIVVNAVEAIIGRYQGEVKWELALKKMKERGFNVDLDSVMDALKAAWKTLDLNQIMAGEKE